MEAPSKLVLLHGIASKSKNILHNITLYYIFKNQMCSKFITAIFTNNHKKSRVAAENLQGYAFSRSQTSAGSTQVQLQRYPLFTLMTMTSQFRACLRAYKNANHVYTMYSSLEIPKCKIQLLSLWSAATGVCHQLKDQKKKEAFTIADCVAVPIAQIKNMSTSSLAWFPWHVHSCCCAETCWRC